MTFECRGREVLHNRNPAPEWCHHHRRCELPGGRKQIYRAAEFLKTVFLRQTSPQPVFWFCRVSAVPPRSPPSAVKTCSGPQCFQTYALLKRCFGYAEWHSQPCLLYTSDAADE